MLKWRQTEPISVLAACWNAIWKALIKGQAPSLGHGQQMLGVRTLMLLLHWGEEGKGSGFSWSENASPPLVDFLVSTVGRVSHISRRTRKPLDSMPRWGQWFCTCEWKMSYLAESSPVWSQQAEVCYPALGGECWHCASPVQCRADPGDPLQGMSKATYSTHAHTHTHAQRYVHGGLGLAGCKELVEFMTVFPLKP